MKNRLINLVIDACYRIDKKRGVLEHYEYETAPYCGHHYNGTKGVLYSSHYHEGDGGERADVLGFRFGRDTDDEYWWSFRYKVVREVFDDGLFIADSNYTTFLNELKAVFHYKKHGFSLRYRIKRK
tara:strand:+ start:98 stop:475 length:378 start_codon:yes stop_codon:yes gene_type:complete